MVLPNLATGSLKARGATTSRPLSDHVAQGRVDIRDFGAKGNDTDDDTLSIQAAVDYALQNRIGKVYCPPGFISKISNTIHLGYGTGSQVHSTVVLEGDVATYVDQSSAFILKAYFKDRPIINIQGGRNSGVRRIRIEGSTPIQTDMQGQTLAWRATASNYVPSGATDNARAPFCGVCVDGYSGTAPPTPYPRPPYPAFLGAITGAYGTDQATDRRASSAFFIEDCVIQFSLIGICVHPNSDGNGDFGNFRGTVIQYEKVAISFGNSQARCNDFRMLNIFGIHTVFDGLQYTAGANGVVSGSFDGVHLNTYYRAFNIAANWNYPLVVTNVYSEVGMRIGDFTAAGSIKFIGCMFDSSDTNRFIPNSEIWNEPIVTNGSGLTFQHCDMIYHRAGAYFQGNDIKFDQCSFRVAGWETAIAGNELIAMKAFGGVFVDIDVGNPSPFPLITNSGSTYGPLIGCDRPALNTWYGKGSVDYVVHNYDVPNQFSRVHAVSVPAPTYSGRVLSSNVGAGQFFKVGDVFYGLGSGFANWFFCTSYNSGTGALTMQAMFNYKWNGTTYTMFNATPPTTFYYFPAGVMDTPVDVSKFMVTAAGSAIVQIVDGAGASVARPAAITIDSKPFWWHPTIDRMAGVLPFPATAVVSSVASPNQFTMSQNALMAGTWIMAPGIKRLK